MNSHWAGPVALIVNTASRAGAQSYAIALRRLSERGVEVARALNVSQAHLIRDLVRTAIAEGYRLIIVGGGDGTITAVAGEFAYKDVVLGVLPVGTGNSFARSLSLPLEPLAAIDAIIDGKVVPVDLGVVNGRYFANTSAIGISAVVGRRTPALLKRIAGPFAYVMVGTLVAATSRAFECTAEVDGEVVFSGKTHQVVVANGRFFGTTPVSPDARVDEGMLTFFSLVGESRWHIARLWLRIIFGLAQHEPDASLGRAVPRVRLTTNPRRSVDIDGEIATRIPAAYEVAAKAMRVVVPAAFEPSS